MQASTELLHRHAKRVMMALGKGHSERVYHRAMITSLNRQGVLHRSEVISPIYFMGEVVGFGRCDLIIDDLIVEFKANIRAPSAASTQLKKYIESQQATEKRQFHGVVINFNQKTGGVDLWVDTKPKVSRFFAPETRSEQNEARRERNKRHLDTRVFSSRLRSGKRRKN
jgi:GxxExxY protein